MDQTRPTPLLRIGPPRQPSLLPVPCIRPFLGAAAVAGWRTDALGIGTDGVGSARPHANAGAVSLGEDVACCDG